MTVRVFVHLSGRDEFEDFPDWNDSDVPDVGEEVKIGGMRSPEIVKKRHFKRIESKSLDPDESLLEAHLEV
jgi:hypothetical protein